jgi:hypothetical protein
MGVPPAVGVRGPEDCLRHPGFIGAALCVQLRGQQARAKAIRVGGPPASLNGGSVKRDVVPLLCQVGLHLRGYCIHYSLQLLPKIGVVNGAAGG